MSTTESILPPISPAASELLRVLEMKVHPALVGQPYLFARRSYGNELTLHFGQEQRYSSPKLAGKLRGSHVLSVRGSAYMLISASSQAVVSCGFVPPLSAQPFNVTALESGALISPGATVSQLEFRVMTEQETILLAVHFSDGSLFLLIPTPPEPGTDDLPEPADWELLTPTSLYRVGPGLEFTIEDKEAPSVS